MALPINSNSQSKKCGQPVSSNCVVYDGPPIAGLCKGASLTEAVYKVSECACTSVTAESPCYTGNWIDFSGGVPTSGSGPNYSFTIGTFGVGNTGNPSYKWTKDGDLTVRGGLVLNLNTSIVKNYIDIPIATLDSACVPVSWTHNQGIVVFVDFFDTDQRPISIRAVLYADKPTNRLILNMTFVNQSLSPMRCEIDFGGTRFNFA